VEVGVRKAILLSLALFITWQVLYFIDLVINGLDWLLAYLVDLAVAICFYIIDRQKASDLGLTKSRLWRRYVIVGFMFAVDYVLYWAVLCPVLGCIRCPNIFNKSDVYHPTWSLYHPLRCLGDTSSWPRGRDRL